MENPKKGYEVKQNGKDYILLIDLISNKLIIKCIDKSTNYIFSSEKYGLKDLHTMNKYFLISNNLKEIQSLLNIAIEKTKIGLSEDIQKSIITIFFYLILGVEENTISFPLLKESNIKKQPIISQLKNSKLNPKYVESLENTLKKLKVENNLILKESKMLKEEIKKLYMEINELKVETRKLREDNNLLREKIKLITKNKSNKNKNIFENKKNTNEKNNKEYKNINIKNDGVKISKNFTNNIINDKILEKNYKGIKNNIAKQIVCDENIKKDRKYNDNKKEISKQKDIILNNENKHCENSQNINNREDINKDDNVKEIIKDFINDIIYENISENNLEDFGKDVNKDENINEIVTNFINDIIYENNNDNIKEDIKEEDNIKVIIKKFINDIIEENNNDNIKEDIKEEDNIKVIIKKFINDIIEENNNDNIKEDIKEDENIKVIIKNFISDIIDENNKDNNNNKKENFNENNKENINEIISKFINEMINEINNDNNVLDNDKYKNNENEFIDNTNKKRIINKNMNIKENNKLNNKENISGSKNINIKSQEYEKLDKIKEYKSREKIPEKKILKKGIKTLYKRDINKNYQLKPKNSNKIVKNPNKKNLKLYNIIMNKQKLLENSYTYHSFIKFSNIQKEKEENNSYIDQRNYSYNPSLIKIHNLKMNKNDNLSYEYLTSAKISKKLRENYSPLEGDIIKDENELNFISNRIHENKYKIYFNLLYKLSEDKDKSLIFHRNCDYAQTTLVLIETKNKYRFGGFTKRTWKGCAILKIDKDAFIFSLNKMKIYNAIKGKNSIGCYENYGPIFYGGFKINDNAFNNGGNTFKKGLNYEISEDYELTNGEENFEVKEIEVYKINIA